MQDHRDKDIDEGQCEGTKRRRTVMAETVTKRKIS